MQERRTIIRISHHARMQYCSSEDLLPRDGRITDLSERGAGLLVREGHRPGEMVSLGFSLPGEETALTATGVVRWSSESSGRRWYPIGLDWMQLEETTRNRLHRFLASSTAAHPASPKKPWSWQQTALLSVSAAALAVAGIVLYFWVRSLEWENRQLQGVIEQRDTVIDQLEQEDARLKLELGEARTHLAETASEVARLDVQTQNFGEQVGRLTEEVDRFQQSYLQVRQEREQLMQQVLDLEQERAALTKRLSSLEELRLAIREAIDTRKNAERAQRLSLAQARRDADKALLANGNRGYLIRDGRPTIGNATVWIRVHEPEASP